MKYIVHTLAKSITISEEASLIEISDRLNLREPFVILGGLILRVADIQEIEEIAENQ